MIVVSMSLVTYTQRVAVICLVMVIAMLSPSVTRSQDTPGAVVDAWSVDEYFVRKKWRKCSSATSARKRAFNALGVNMLFVRNH